MKKYIRADFLKRVRQLLDDFEEEHEEYTGVPDHEMGFDSWMQEIMNAEENTS